MHFIYWEMKFRMLLAKKIRLCSGKNVGVGFTNTITVHVNNVTIIGAPVPKNCPMDSYGYVFTFADVWGAQVVVDVEMDSLNYTGQGSGDNASPVVPFVRCGLYHSP